MKLKLEALRALPLIAARCSGDASLHGALRENLLAPFMASTAAMTATSSAPGVPSVASAGISHKPTGGMPPQAVGRVDRVDRMDGVDEVDAFPVPGQQLTILQVPALFRPQEVLAQQKDPVALFDMYIQALAHIPCLLAGKLELHPRPAPRALPSSLYIHFPFVSFSSISSCSISLFAFLRFSLISRTYLLCVYNFP